jgi:exopolyphosphatase/guanosine-5'-triphosphate,3'-diphosphate pyrophosphatase
MKIASIDIGTNSIRLLLAEFDGKHFTNVSKKLQMTRLGKGVNETQLLDQDRINESVDVIVSFCNDAKAFDAEKIVLMATSAVRDAHNSKIFTDEVLQKTGQTIDVIEGSLEAEVGFLGVLLGNSNPTETVLVIDIGGGSTELIVGNKDGIRFAKSLNIGAVRLTGAYIKHDPVLQEETLMTLEVIKNQLSDVSEALNRYKIDTVIGIGGTATTFATMVHVVTQYSREVVHGLSVTLPELERFNHTLSKLNIEQRKAVAGLEPKRADIIYVGGLILESIIKMIDKDVFSVSDYDNLEGYIAYKLKV